jgi:oxygen-independent coproporphyrinogen-3 oxidase
VPGVYLSYPFCAQKCTYCNFASGVFPRALEERYLLALAAEIRAHEWQWQPETVYLGGGTPSSLAPAELASFLTPIPGRPWLEATLEAAPGSITPEKARAWASLGIGRVSLGVQSFVETEIRRTGRRHTAGIVAAELAILRDAGISNCNIGKERLLGGIRYGAADVPDDDRIADFYEFAVERLAALGIPRYEISNFARLGAESRHNLKYWTLAPYVGFGADAHSFDGAIRRQNPESIDDYLSQTPASAEPGNPAYERFFVGLRLSSGIRPSQEEWVRFANPIRRFLDDGLLESAGGMLRLTDRGVMLSNEVFQEFLPL